MCSFDVGIWFPIVFICVVIYSKLTHYTFEFFKKNFFLNFLNFALHSLQGTFYATRKWRLNTYLYAKGEHFLYPSIKAKKYDLT